MHLSHVTESLDESHESQKKVSDRKEKREKRNKKEKRECARSLSRLLIRGAGSGPLALFDRPSLSILLVILSDLSLTTFKPKSYVRKS